MFWALLAAVVGLVVFAAVHDALARRRGTYRPPEEWDAARARRRSQWKHRGVFRPAGPKDGDRQ
jgi:hypothetical protein